MKKSIYGLTMEQLTEWLLGQGQKKFRAAQIWDWLYKKSVTNFADMKNINKECIELLDANFAIQTLEQSVKQESADGTIKFLFKMQDGNLIETVLMKFHYGYSVCVTTQVGCNIGCSFCASGLLKKSRDLNAGEIVEQIMKVQFHLGCKRARRARKPYCCDGNWRTVRQLHELDEISYVSSMTKKGFPLVHVILRFQQVD